MLLQLIVASNFTSMNYIPYQQISLKITLLTNKFKKLESFKSCLKASNIRVFLFIYKFQRCKCLTLKDNC